LRAFALIWWFAHFNHGLMYMQQALPCTALTKKMFIRTCHYWDIFNCIWNRICCI